MLYIQLRGSRCLLQLQIKILPFGVPEGLEGLGGLVDIVPPAAVKKYVCE